MQIYVHNFFNYLKIIHIQLVYLNLINNYFIGAHSIRICIPSSDKLVLVRLDYTIKHLIVHNLNRYIVALGLNFTDSGSKKVIAFLWLSMTICHEFS